MDKDLPNIILIMTDDLGCSELGSYGQWTIQTPNLDIIAADHPADLRIRLWLLHNQP